MSPEQIVQSLLWQKLSAIGSLVAAVAAIIGLIGIAIAIWQIVSGKKWNKLHFTFSFLPSPVDLENVEKDIDSVIGLWKRPEGDPLSTEEIKALFGMELSTDETKAVKSRHPNFNADMFTDAGRKLKVYCNLIEKFCVAINTGIADSQAAMDVYGYKFRAHYNKLKPYIEWIRKDRNEASIYIEFEKVITKHWYPQQDATAARKRY